MQQEDAKVTGLGLGGREILLVLRLVSTQGERTRGDDGTMEGSISEGLVSFPISSGRFSVQCHRLSKSTGFNGTVVRRDLGWA